MQNVSGRKVKAALPRASFGSRCRRAKSSLSRAGSLRPLGRSLAAGPGGRDYGILSVFLQAWYDVSYEFTVGPEVFNPPPKVHSGVIRCRRNDKTDLGCNERGFIMVVKAGFNQRRKTLRNALKPLGIPEAAAQSAFMDKRAEQLSVVDFVALTLLMDRG